MKVLVTDPLPKEALQLLRAKGHELLEFPNKDAAGDALAEAEAWMVRSGTQITEADLDRAPKLLAIGRAGVGVDNIDLEAATRRGIPVLHAPTGNITSACEQAWALLLALARRVPEADAGMKAERWLRKELKGFELAGRTIFIVGLGRIGRMMAARAQAFEMETLGFDPFVDVETAKTFGVERVEMGEGLARADIVSLHTPLTPQTRDLIDADALATMKPGSVLINAARGGLVDGNALLASLESGHLAGAGLDVFPAEPPEDWALPKHPRVVAAPHLGASTVEAQVKAATQAVDRLLETLDNQDASLAVNASVRLAPEHRPWALLAERLGSFGIQTLRTNLVRIRVSGPEGLPMEELGLHAGISCHRNSQDQAVSAVNIRARCADLGWRIDTESHAEGGLEVTLESERGRIQLYGVLEDGKPRLRRIDGFSVDTPLEGRLLLTRHVDRPGALAGIAACLADAQVNVAQLSLSRSQQGEDALALITVDGGIPKVARDGLRNVAQVHEAHRIRLS